MFLVKGSNFILVVFRPMIWEDTRAFDWFVTYFMEKKVWISRIQFRKGYDLWVKTYSAYLLLTKLMLQLQVIFSLRFKLLHENDGNDLHLNVKTTQGKSFEQKSSSIRGGHRPWSINKRLLWTEKFKRRQRTFVVWMMNYIYSLLHDSSKFFQ